MIHEVARYLADQASDPSSGSGRLLGIAAVISAIGIALGGVIGAVTSLIRAWRAPTHRDRKEEDSDDDDE